MTRAVDLWPPGTREILGRKQLRFARQFVIRQGDAYVDFYTRTPVLSSAPELVDIIENASGRVFIIGSGEQQSDGRRQARGAQVDDLVKSRFTEVWSGRDGLTKVWLLPGPQRASSAEVHSRPAEPGHTATATNH